MGPPLQAVVVLVKQLVVAVIPTSGSLDIMHLGDLSHILEGEEKEAKDRKVTEEREKARKEKGKERTTTHRRGTPGLPMARTFASLITTSGRGVQVSTSAALPMFAAFASRSTLPTRARVDVQGSRLLHKYRSQGRRGDYPSPSRTA